MKTLLEVVQKDLLEFVSNLEHFKHCSVLSENKSDLDNLHLQKLEASKGVAVVVSYPVPLKIIANVPGLCFEELGFQIGILELRSLCSKQSNNNAKLAENLISELHGKTFKQSTWSGKVVARPTNPWEEEKSCRSNLIKLNFIVENFA